MLFSIATSGMAIFKETKQFTKLLSVEQNSKEF